MDTSKSGKKIFISLKLNMENTRSISLWSAISCFPLSTLSFPQIQQPSSSTLGILTLLCLCCSLGLDYSVSIRTLLCLEAVKPPLPLFHRMFCLVVAGCSLTCLFSWSINCGKQRQCHIHLSWVHSTLVLGMCLQGKDMKENNRWMNEWMNGCYWRPRDRHSILKLHRLIPTTQHTLGRRANSNYKKSTSLINLSWCRNNIIQSYLVWKSWILSHKTWFNCSHKTTLIWNIKKIYVSSIICHFSCVSKSFFTFKSLLYLDPGEKGTSNKTIVE